MNAEPNPKAELECNPALAPAPLLGQRLGFIVYPQGSPEEKRIRDAIHQAKVARLISTSHIGLSESEAALLCKRERHPRYLMAKAQMTPTGMCKSVRLGL